MWERLPCRDRSASVRSSGQSRRGSRSHIHGVLYSRSLDRRGRKSYQRGTAAPMKRQVQFLSLAFWLSATFASAQSPATGPTPEELARRIPNYKQWEDFLLKAAQQ